MLVVSLSEEILDDGVGLFLESSGDSLDDDSEILSEFDECTKVRAQCFIIFITSENIRQPGFHITRQLRSYFPVLDLYKPPPPAPAPQVCHYEKALMNVLLHHSLTHHLLLARFILFMKAEQHP